MKRILVALNHPAHYYIFKYTVKNLKELGFEVNYVIRNKDVLEKLLLSEGVDYVKINKKRNRTQNAFSVISNGVIELFIQDFNLLRYVLKWRPNLMIGTDIAITHVGLILNIPSFVFNEDDYEINKLFCKSCYPFATKIIAPDNCSVGPYINKKIGYNGFQKMAYTNPKYFQPDFNEIKELVNENEKYFIIRLVSLTSGHDIEGTHRGINETLLDKIINILEPKGKVFINNEGRLNPKYNNYKIQIPTNKMHHLLAFASIFIGDSQTMCAEAGLFGTPFIRFNDFVGKIQYLNDIEIKYNLGFGVPANNPDLMIEKLEELLNTDDLKLKWQPKVKKIFEEKIDTTDWYTQLIKNFLN